MPSKQGEFSDKEQYHNKVHEVVLKSGETLYGLVSRVDCQKREFYLLEHDQVGMFGSKSAGKKISWEDCRSIKSENQRTGSFEDPMIPIWERWGRQSGVE